MGKENSCDIHSYREVLTFYKHLILNTLDYAKIQILSDKCTQFIE